MKIRISAIILFRRTKFLKVEVIDHLIISDETYRNRSAPTSSFRLGRRNPGARDGKPAGTYNARCRHPIERFVISNNLPAKPGAFVCEPLKAAFGGANATPPICYRLKDSVVQVADLPPPDVGCTRGSPAHRDRQSRHNTPSPKNAAQQNCAYAHHRLGPRGSHFSP